MPSNLVAAYYTGFDALPRTFEPLFAERPGLTFDQSLGWLRRLAELLAEQGGTPTIIGLADGGGPVAALPLLKRAPRDFGTADLQGITNYYTAHYGAILAPGVSAREVADDLAAAIMGLPDPWQVLDLNPLDPEGELFTGLAAGLKRRGAAITPYFRFGNWYEEIGGRSYDEYFGARPTQVRETVRRKGRKLAKETSCTFEIVTSEADVHAAMDAYESIYAKSWKQAEPHQQFLREIARAFAASGWLRLGVLRVDGRPAAAQMWFVYSGTASIFKLAYDPDFTKYSVGSLLTSHLMNHVLTADRVGVVDYLCGDDPYKKEWMTKRRERWGLRVFRLSSLRGMVGAALAVAGRTIRRFRS